MVARTMETAGYRIVPFESYFDAVYQRFAQPGVWELFPDVQATLTKLSSLNLRLGVISNFDRRLYAVLGYLGVLDAFEHIIISSEIGVRKPAPRIFRTAARRFNVELKEVLHVGDESKSDFDGARAAGLEALLVDHKSTMLPSILERLV